MLLSLFKSVMGRRKTGSKKEPAAAHKPLEECTDEELMARYGEGEAQAFDLLMKRHERGIYNFILRSVKRQEIAEELLQEVFIRVIRNASSYTHSAKFTTWLYTIARNICIDRARKHNRRKELSLDEKIGGDDAGASYVDMLVDESASVSHMSHERQQFLERLHEALSTLPEEQREVFLLKEVSGLKFREIAEVVDAPVPTVKSRMRYALQALRGHMEIYKDLSFDEEERMEVVT
jgi:RNA polymerase sigma-70 factor (ECF subfamily)